MLVSMPCFCRISHALMPSQVDAICSHQHVVQNVRCGVDKLQ